MILSTWKNTIKNTLYLQRRLSALEGVPVSQQELLLAGRPLEGASGNESSLVDFADLVAAAGVSDAPVRLTLEVSLPGGKVHGSLARAGKVKGQTPKACTNFSIILLFFHSFCWHDCSSLLRGQH